MNQAKFEAIFRSQSATAKKVYEATPISEAWTAHKIGGEMLRLGHSTSNVSILTGCLNTLKEAGIVSEPRPGLFVRTAVRQKAAGEPEARRPTITTTTTVQPPPEAQPMTTAPALTYPRPTLPTPAPGDKPGGPIEILSKLSGRVAFLTRQLTELASDIDTAALQLAEKEETTARETAKLRQLQELIRGVVSA